MATEDNINGDCRAAAEETVGLHGGATQDNNVVVVRQPTRCVGSATAAPPKTIRIVVRQQPETVGVATAAPPKTIMVFGAAAEETVQGFATAAPPDNNGGCRRHRRDCAGVCTSGATLTMRLFEAAARRLCWSVTELHPRQMVFCEAAARDCAGVCNGDATQDGRDVCDNNPDNDNTTCGNGPFCGDGNVDAGGVRRR